MPYSGPGDVLSGAVAFWGLRGYNAAVSNGTTKAIQVRRSSDSTTQDIVVLSTGGLDWNSANSFRGGGTLTVVKVYDQTGNGHDATAASTSNEASLILNGGPTSTAPALQSAGGAESYAIGSFTLSQPLSASWYGIQTSANTNFGALLLYESGVFYIGFNTSGTPFHYAGTSTSFGSPELGSWINVRYIFDTTGGGNVVIQVNGGTDTGNDGAGSGGITGATTLVGNGVNLSLIGSFQELALWPSSTIGHEAAIYANVNNYWTNYVRPPGGSPGIGPMLLPGIPGLAKAVEPIVLRDLVASAALGGARALVDNPTMTRRSLFLPRSRDRR